MSHSILARFAIFQSAITYRYVDPRVREFTQVMAPQPLQPLTKVRRSLGINTIEFIDCDEEEEEEEVCLFDVFDYDVLGDYDLEDFGM